MPLSAQAQNDLLLRASGRIAVIFFPATRMFRLGQDEAATGLITHCLMALR